MIGELVLSTAGHDKGEIYMIVGEEGGFLLIADGRYKKIDSPKKKNRKHLQRIGKGYETTLSERIRNNDPTVRDEEIKKLIKDYKRSITNVKI